ncbi:hypothetical protein ACI3PL_26340, partial [Lacticaseibacillus paracasei]
MDNKPVNNSPIQQINERYNLPNSKLAQKINEYFRTHTPEQIYEAFEAAREQRISAPLSEGEWWNDGMPLYDGDYLCSVIE